MPTILDDGTKLYSRKEIGYRYGKGGRGAQKRQNVIIHTGVSGTGGLSPNAEMAICRAYERYHVQVRKMAGIAYSALGGDSGTIYEGRGWGQNGAHTQNGGNFDGHALCYIGDGTKAPPTAMGWRAGRAWIREGIRGNYIPVRYTLQGHRDRYAKACPGDYIYNRMHKELGPDVAVEVPQELLEDDEDMAKLVDAGGYIYHVSGVTAVHVGTGASYAALLKQGLVVEKWDPKVFVDTHNITWGGGAPAPK